MDGGEGVASLADYVTPRERAAGTLWLGTAVAQWLRCCATNRKVVGSIPAGVSGVDSASNRNEYQEHFLGVKCGRCLRLTTLPSFCAVVTKSGNLNFLEPSGPVQACNGTALPLGTAVAQWLRCCATNRKVAGSIPAGVSGFFIDIKPWGRLSLQQK